VDGAKDVEGWEDEFGLEVTCRFPALRTFGNWTLSLAEMYVRQPKAERYAVFQDDLITVRNLRQYLEAQEYPAGKAYWNLYTARSNLEAAPKGDYRGWFDSNQMGRGALALVFDREAVQTLLSSRHMVDRPTDEFRGWRSVDGGIVTAMKKARRKELCHTPTLVHHTGMKSTMLNAANKDTTGFPGERFDALSFLPERAKR